MANSGLHDLLHLRSEVERLEKQVPLASSKDDALETALLAAELSMKALKLADDPSIRKLMNNKVKSLLDEAERIKTTGIWKVVNDAVKSSGDGVGEIDVSKLKLLEEPVSTRRLTTAEEILLLKASKLNGFKFVPWKDPPPDTEFEIKEGEVPFRDAPELRLSKTQLKVFDEWKRAEDALPPPAWLVNEVDRGRLGPTMTAAKGIDLVQDAATDCSVVASLCSGVARGERGHATILSQVMYPYDPSTKRPKLSPNGKYIVRLNFNGAYRKVEIDDRLPVSKTPRVLHVVDRRTPGLLWPALLEKAYLKVRGSYDFPGSNSGTDLWIMSGWIPEQVFIQSDDTIPNQVWKRIYGAHKFGDVLVTMGTGKMSARAEKDTGLAGEHDYAVLDLREVDGQNLLLVKNPWCEGTSWTGSTPKLESSNGQERTTYEDEDTLPSSRDLLNSNDQLTPGTFWMDLNSVLQHFESIYLNWNPGLFGKRQDIHFPWDLTPENPRAISGKYRSFANHPQFRVTVAKGGSLWILLCRHFRDPPPATSTAQAFHDTTVSGFISIYAYDNEGARVFISDNALLRGPFVDSPQTLLKLDNVEPGKAYTIVPVEQDLPQISHTFTISAFAHSALSIDNALNKFQHRTTTSGSWTQETAGGHAHSANYSQNPQFSIKLDRKASLTLLLETPGDPLHVHVKLLLGRGQRVESVRSRDIIIDSKDYRLGCAIATIHDLDAGTYTIICSTYEAGKTGDFTLRVDSTVPTVVKPLPREGAGRVRVKLPDAAFHGQQLRLAAPLVPRRLSKMRILAKHTNQSTVATKAQMQRRERSMVRVTVEVGRGPERRILIASAGGEYSDSIAGVRTDEIDLSPQMFMGQDGQVWLVIERMFTPRELPEEILQVEMFTETPDALQVGVWRKWDD